MWEKYRTNGKPSLFDQIIEQGKVVLVTVGPEDPVMGKILCTLIKCLFQQSVMSRLERFNSGRLTNFTRPVFIACDEFAEIASEVPGQPMGDGRFFSLARQNGCMGILATQSIHTLENSSLAESWKSIFSNLAAKIFMGAADNETAEQACELAGQVDWEMSSNTEGYGKDGSFSQQRSIVQRPELTPYVLTHVLRRGQAVAIGSLDGRETAPMLRFIEVPEESGRPTTAMDSPETEESDGHRSGDAAGDAADRGAEGHGRDDAGQHRPSGRSAERRRFE
jgi:TraM recognition site of TraD and TraG